MLLAGILTYMSFFVWIFAVFMYFRNKEFLYKNVQYIYYAITTVFTSLVAYYLSLFFGYIGIFITIALLLLWISVTIIQNKKNNKSNKNLKIILVLSAVILLYSLYSAYEHQQNIDWYNQEVDKVIGQENQQDWKIFDYVIKTDVTNAVKRATLAPAE